MDNHLVQTYAPPPFIVKEGFGSYLEDTSGKRYLDFTSGIGVNALGHAHPEVVQAIVKQAKTLCHTSNAFVHSKALLLAKKLAELSLGERVFFTNSGAEANECALKLARRYFFKRGEKRYKFVSTHGSFHGRTLATLTLSGQPKYHQGFEPMLPDVSYATFGDIDSFNPLLTAQTAAVMIEPIQGNAGVHTAPKGFFTALHALCKKRGVLLIVDEIQTGIGRTGEWLAQRHDNISADITTIAKALGGGLPLGAMLTSDAISQGFDVGSHGTTFGGNPVACAASLATLNIIERDNLLEHVTSMGRYLQSELGKLNSSHNNTRHAKCLKIRGTGLMIGMEFEQPIKELRQRCRQNGLLLTAAGPNVLRFLPPLNVSIKEIDTALEILAQTL